MARSNIALFILRFLLYCNQIHALRPRGFKAQRWIPGCFCGNQCVFEGIPFNIVKLLRSWKVIETAIHVTFWLDSGLKRALWVQDATCLGKSTIIFEFWIPLIIESTHWSSITVIGIFSVPSCDCKILASGVFLSLYERSKAFLNNRVDFQLKGIIFIDNIVLRSIDWPGLGKTFLQSGLSRKLKAFNWHFILF